MNKIIVKSFMFEAVPTIVAPIAINILYLFFFSFSQKDNCSILYLFSKDQEPSFKLVEQVIPSVQTLSKDILELTFEPFNYNYNYYLFTVATGDDNLHKDVSEI